MRARSLWTRVFAPTAFVALLAMAAHATPMQPDVRRMIEEQQRPQPQFALARAGWNGPEVRRAEPATISPALAQFNPALAARANRAALAAAAVPDVRALVMLSACILLLRWVRHTRST